MLNFGDADTTQKATGATSAQMDFVCVICTSNSSTAAAASLSLLLCVCVSLFKGTSQRYRHLSTCPFIFSLLQQSACYNKVLVQTAFIPYYLSTDTDFVCVLCTSSSTAAVASLFLPLSLSLSLSLFLFRGTSHNKIAISVPTLLFFRSYNDCTNGIYSPLSFWQVQCCRVAIIWRLALDGG